MCDKPLSCAAFAHTIEKAGSLCLSKTANEYLMNMPSSCHSLEQQRAGLFAGPILKRFEVI